MAVIPSQVIYGTEDKTVREAVQSLRGLGPINLVPSTVFATAGTVTGTAWNFDNNGFGQLEVVLNVTAAANLVGDTLDILVDSSLDGAIFVNIIHFTQILGNGGAKKFTAILPRSGSNVMADVSADLTAGNMRSFIGSLLRVRVAVVDGGAHGQSFTLSVTGTLKP